jgi:hypothetical protein
MYFSDRLSKLDFLIHFKKELEFFLSLIMTSRNPQEKIAKQFLDRLVAWAKHIKVSDPLEEGCRLGSVVSEGQVIKLSVSYLLKFCCKCIPFMNL